MSLTKHKILLIEPDDQIRKGLYDILHLNKYIVAQSANIAKAEKHILENKSPHHAMILNTSLLQDKHSEFSKSFEKNPGQFKIILLIFSFHNEKESPVIPEFLKNEDVKIISWPFEINAMLDLIALSKLD